MPKVTTKGVFVALFAVFAIYSVIVRPQDAADAVRAVFFFLADAVRSIFSFFDALLN